ncbi:unnamed protein product [Strongylus vulgaris]|uniref:Uncharacterized protein n=1 Tax=Strongylus vulgaris TaxID=40348 RepID=A0A3P7IDT7_STRVU|nr:unnamed protein product [Strongylus vulgaris]
MTSKGVIFCFLLILLQCSADDSLENSDETDKNRTGDRLKTPNESEIANAEAAKDLNASSVAPEGQEQTASSPFLTTTLPASEVPGTGETQPSGPTSSSYETSPSTTVAPALPRPPHFTAGSFFSKLFAASK